MHCCTSILKIRPKLETLGCGLSQIHHGDKSRQYAVRDWGGGINTNDAGCAYALFPVDDEKMKPTSILSLPKDQHRVVVENGVFKLGTGGREVQLFDLSGRRIQPGRLPPKGVFVIGPPMEKRWCSVFRKKWHNIFKSYNFTLFAIC